MPQPRKHADDNARKIAYKERNREAINAKKRLEYKPIFEERKSSNVRDCIRLKGTRERISRGYLTC
jgi:hypothetical protein